jgi:hypothetical protein
LGFEAVQKWAASLCPEPVEKASVAHAEAVMREKAKAKLDQIFEAVEAVRNLNDKPDEPVVTEDAFAPPSAKPKHEEPPKDPNAPSGSLSSDDAERISVDFNVPSKPKT